MKPRGAMRWRLGIVAWVLATLAGPAVAQERDKSAPLPRIGILLLPAPDHPQSLRNLAWYEEGLRLQGLLKDRDYRFDVRSAQGSLTNLASAANALAVTRPALMFTGGNLPVKALMNSEPVDVPVVGIGGAGLFSGDEVTRRAQGRGTGMTVRQVPLNAKRLELLAELCVPGRKLMHLGEPPTRDAVMPEMESLSRRRGLQPLMAYARDAAEAEAAFAAAAREGACGVNVLESSLFVPLHARMIELARKHRMPAVFQWPELAAEGALMAYGPGRRDMNLQAMAIVARVLRGEKPADIAVEEPLRWLLVLNAREARTIGVSLPASLLARADEVIE